jgi:hypothetical protein
MSTSRRRRLNRTAAEQLLRSRPASLLADGDALASLLVAAAAPARDRELAGEAEAVTAFREAHLSPVTQPRRPLMSATTKLLAIKAALAVMGVTGGGVALAAATGHLPSQLGGTPAAAGSAQASASATATPSPSRSPESNPAASPSPSLRGLCQAFTAGAGSNPGKALGNPAFTALITAAGGKDKVAAFCTGLLAAKPGHTPTAHPTGKPSSLPTQAPTAHPTGKPTTIPTAHPTAHPTGKPTSHP